MIIAETIALIIYCTLAFGIHGGEGVKIVNRPLRNLLCALPFALVFYSFGWKASTLAFVLSFVGVNIGFKDLPGGKPNYLWLPVKGFVTFPLSGWATLPLAYWLSYKTRWTNVAAEYLSGTFYGLILSVFLWWKP